MGAIYFIAALLIAGAIGLAIVSIFPLTPLTLVLAVIFVIFVLIAIIFAIILLVDTNKHGHDRRC